MENEPKYNSSELIKIINETEDNLDSVFRLLRKKSRENGLSVEEKNSLVLLEKVTAITLSPSNIIDAYDLHYTSTDQIETQHPFNFSADDIHHLTSIIPSINGNQLKARISDLIWFCVRKDNFHHAQNAIESYLLSAFGRQYTEWRSNTRKELERACRLSQATGQKEQIKKIEQYLLNMLEATKESNVQLFYEVAMLVEQLGILKDNLPEILSKIESVAEAMCQNKDFELASRYYELCVRLYGESNITKRTLMLCRAAECYANHAKILAAGTSGQKLISHHWFETAIAAFRRIDNIYRESYDVDNQIENLRHELTVAGQFIVSMIPSQPEPIDDAEYYIRDAKEQIAQQVSLSDAMIMFLQISLTPTLEQLNAPDLPSAGLFSSFFSSAITFSSEGLVNDRSIRTKKNTDDSIQPDHTNSLFFLKMAEISAKCRVMPALIELHKCYLVDKAILFEICSMSALIPRDSINLVVEAMWLGFQRKFFSSVFMIGPLVEKIIRATLKEDGVLTSTLLDVEDEISLASLLEKPELREIFNVDILFELKMIFASRVGPNLRNASAHGLLTDATANSWSAIYGWWLFVKLVVLSVMKPTEIYSATADII